MFRLSERWMLDVRHTENQRTNMDRKAWILAGACGLVLVYCTARAACLSMTHDESTTVLMFASRPWGQILANEPPSANNHLLNTLLVKLFMRGGLNKVWIRLPNLLGALVYLFFAFRFIQGKGGSLANQVLGFALLVFNPYLLEFFSLARGYGLSLGFLIGSLYFIHRYTLEEQPGTLAWSALLAVLGCYSNLTLLNYFVGLWGAANLFLLFRKGGFQWGQWVVANGLLLFFALLLFALLYAPVRANQEAGAFYFGGETGFFSDTFTSLVSHFIAERRYLGKHTVPILAWAGGLLMGLAVGHQLLNWAQRRHFESGAFYSVLLILMALSTVVQHQWLGTPYLTGRTALLFYPVSALLLWEFFRRRPDWIQWVLAALLAGNMAMAANLSQSQDWWYDRYTESVTRYVASRRQGEEHIRFGANWLFVPTISFYRKAWGIDFFIGPNMDREVPTGKYFDYYYLHQDDAGKLHPDYELEQKFGAYSLMKLPPEKKEPPEEE